MPLSGRGAPAWLGSLRRYTDTACYTLDAPGICRVDAFTLRPDALIRAPASRHDAPTALARAGGRRWCCAHALSLPSAEGTQPGGLSPCQAVSRGERQTGFPGIAVLTGAGAPSRASAALRSVESARAYRMPEGLGACPHGAPPGGLRPADRAFPVHRAGGMPGRVARVAGLARGDGGEGHRGCVRGLRPRQRGLRQGALRQGAHGRGLCWHGGQWPVASSGELPSNPGARITAKSIIASSATRSITKPRAPSLASAALMAAVRRGLTRPGQLTRLRAAG